MSDESTDTRRLPLRDAHLALEVTMGDEGGWEVPLSYDGPIAEAGRARTDACVIDVTCRSRIRIRGPEAWRLLDRVCTHAAARQEDDSAVATVLCNERGGALDAGHLLRLESFWVLVGEPVNREKTLEHLTRATEGFDATVDDQTGGICQLAAIGPRAGEALDAALPISVSDAPAGSAKFGSVLVARYIAARAGVTGEWTLQVMLPTALAARAWRHVTGRTDEAAIAPAGWGAMDVLRVEAGACRYGRELSEAIDPLTAGLDARVNFDHDFIGREALERVRAAGSRRRRIGLTLPRPAGGEAPSLPRQGASVYAGDGRHVGEITSATYSPALEAPIAMAYVTPDVTDDTPLEVDAPAGRLEASVAPLPFVRVPEPPG